MVFRLLDWLVAFSLGCYWAGRWAGPIGSAELEFISWANEASEHIQLIKKHTWQKSLDSPNISSSSMTKNAEYVHVSLFHHIFDLRQWVRHFNRHKQRSSCRTKEKRTQMLPDHDKQTWNFNLAPRWIPYHPCMVYIPTYVYHRNQPFMQVDIPFPWMVWYENDSNSATNLLICSPVYWLLLNVHRCVLHPFPYMCPSCTFHPPQNRLQQILPTPPLHSQNTQWGLVHVPKFTT